MLSFVFFFQAEDGIRDLVRSRGLGDVYKRQVAHNGSIEMKDHVIERKILLPIRQKEAWDFFSTPVSYTHLTLPTSDLV